MNVYFRADDIGNTKGINEAVWELVERGRIRNASVMVNVDFAEHAALLLGSMEGLALGLHINLTSGKPVTNPTFIPSLIQENGCFKPSSYYRKALDEGRDLVVFDEAYREAKSQLTRFQELFGRRPDYIDVHALSNPNLTKASITLADRENILFVPSFPIEFTRTSGMSFDPYILSEDSEDAIVERLEEELFRKGDNSLIFIFHPAHIDDDLKKRSSLVERRKIDYHFLNGETFPAFLKAHGLDNPCFSQ